MNGDRNGDLTKGEDRLLVIAREVYADQRDRHDRAYRVALGLLSLNTALVGFMLTVVWRLVYPQSGSPAPAESTVETLDITPVLVILALGVMATLISALLHTWVATRIKVDWPNTLMLCGEAVKHPEILAAGFLAEMYAEATAANQKKVDKKFQIIAYANICTVVALLCLAAAVGTAAYHSPI
jgi:hypothetical protein